MREKSFSLLPCEFCNEFLTSDLLNDHQVKFKMNYFTLFPKWIFLALTFFQYLSFESFLDSVQAVKIKSLFQQKLNSKIRIKDNTKTEFKNKNKRQYNNGIQKWTNLTIYLQ